MYLNKYELQNHFQNSKLSADGKNLYGVCPSCRRNEFGISTYHPHKFGCFRKAACGYSGNIYTLIKDGYVKQVVKYKINNIVDFNILDDNYLEKDEPIPEVILPYDFQLIKKHDYIEKRLGKYGDINVLDFNKYKIGLSSVYKNYLMFIVENDKKNVGYVSRYYETDDTGSVRRYLTSKTNVANTLYGLDDIIGETVILVEGIFDKLRFDMYIAKYKIPCVCIATFGCSVSAQQIKHLRKKNIKNIYIFQETDGIGTFRAIQKSAAKLLDYFDVKIANINDGNDPASMNDERISYYLKNLKTIYDYKIINGL